MDVTNMTDTVIFSKDNIFAYLSIDILEDNLEDQISGKIESTINYLDEFENKYNFILSVINSEYPDDTDILDELNLCRKSFYNDTYIKIVDKFGITYLDIKETVLEEDLYQVITALYNFFVLNIEENIINYYTNNIITNRKSIIKGYKPIVNMNDIYCNMVKKTYGKDNAVIIQAIDDYIENETIDSIEEFIENCLANEERNEGLNNIIYDLFVSLETYTFGVTCDINKLTKEIYSIYSKNITRNSITVRNNIIMYFETSKKKG